MRTPLTLACFSSAFFGAAFALLATYALREHNSVAAPTTIVGSDFRLVDARGKLRAQLAFSAEGPPGMFFYDDAGRARLVLGLYPDGQPHVVLNDSASLAAGILRLHAADLPVVVLKQKGQDKVIVGINGIEKR